MSYYNVVFTILPPLVIGVFDQFVSARMLDRYPQLYQLGQQNYFFTPITFFYWVGNAFYHSVVRRAIFACRVSLTTGGAGLVCVLPVGIPRRSSCCGREEFGPMGLGYDVISRSAFDGAR